MSAPFVPGPHHIELGSGAYLDLSDPRPQHIELEDVARGLARTCRFAGHTRRFYSVAEHAVLVADYLEARGASVVAQLCGLHHDDHEAFVGDVTRPLKAMLPDYPALADRVQEAVEQALGIPNAFALNLHRQVRVADDWALAAEAWHLLPSRGATWPTASLYEGTDARLGLGVEWERPLGLGPDRAEVLFLERHRIAVADLPLYRRGAA